MLLEKQNTINLNSIEDDRRIPFVHLKDNEKANENRYLDYGLCDLQEKKNNEEGY